MKIYILVIALVGWPAFLFAQDNSPKDTTLHYLDVDSTWWNAIQFGVNFSQASFSENWSAGGVNSFALNSLFNYQLHYQSNPWSWDNQIEVLYGLVKNADQDVRKSQDRIFVDTKIGYNIAEDWSGFLSVNFLSQLAPGYRYLEDAQGDEDAVTISRFMAPGFLTTSLGFEYKPTDYFWLRLSPFAPRLTFVTDQTLYLNREEEKNFGVPIGETVRYEWLASQLVAELNKNLTENINLQTRYMLFASYESLAVDSLDHRLDFAFNAKLTEYINFSMGAILLYDIDQDNSLQIGQTMGIGFLLQQ